MHELDSFLQKQPTNIKKNIEAILKSEMSKYELGIYEQSPIHFYFFHLKFRRYEYFEKLYKRVFSGMIFIKIFHFPHIIISYYNICDIQ